MTRSILWAAVAVAALGLAACKPPTAEKKAERAPAMSREPYRAVTRLDCPKTQGELTLKTAAADGRRCQYTAEADATEVDLSIVEGEPALAAQETALKALVPPPPPRGDKPVAEISASEKNNDAHIRLPGLSIDADGDRAQVNIGGLHIDGEGDRADISVDRKGDSDVKILADKGGAEIRDNRTNKRGLRRTYILARDNAAPGAYRFVGYEARGPKDGPLVLAVVRAKAQKDTDYVFKDMKALVAHNTGR